MDSIVCKIVSKVYWSCSKYGDIIVQRKCDVYRKRKESAVEQRLWLAELFLTEEGEVAEAEDDLEEHANPESWVAETVTHLVG
jgi:hypothetical protein